jgi:hypothetical protein
MSRTEYRLLAGILVAAIGFVPVAPAAAANTKSKTAQVPAKSLGAKAPVLARVVVTPSSQQLSKILREKRMSELEKRARTVRQTGRSHTATIGAL